MSHSHSRQLSKISERTEETSSVSSDQPVRPATHFIIYLRDFFGSVRDTCFEAPKELKLAATTYNDWLNAEGYGKRILELEENPESFNKKEYLRLLNILSKLYTNCYLAVEAGVCKEEFIKSESHPVERATLHKQLAELQEERGLERPEQTSIEDIINLAGQLSVFKPEYLAESASPSPAASVAGSSPTGSSIETMMFIGSAQNAGLMDPNSPAARARRRSLVIDEIMTKLGIRLDDEARNGS
ncbi:hypothetical protein QBC32DRAFT_391664 [Pseudoneurospora amorphoporcata]|uniref:Uncharacterized protein n=1 Tax=Pseudoneurospora amorphoporcata TaxID=241081 RepID=A0AAN6SK14_9PEZI|nr:hypothetical protein QBC32DRAFT_391664 [Pseudoneurospora amorphoporcata]